jgi:hypothetical protein
MQEVLKKLTSWAGSKGTAAMCEVILREVTEYASALTLPHAGEAEDFRMRRELDHQLL